MAKQKKQIDRRRSRLRDDEHSRASSVRTKHRFSAISYRPVWLVAWISTLAVGALLSGCGSGPGDSQTAGGSTSESVFAEKEKAASRGEIAAQLELAQLYADGKGVAQNSEKAAEWWEKAAAQGDARAQGNLARLYSRGDGVTPDPVKAFELATKAAEHGDAVAQNVLGNAYAHGIGVGKDEKKAIELYEKAAAQGYPNAEYNLAFAYLNGRGVSKDGAKYLDFLQKSASQGLVQSEYILFQSYLRGTNGVSKDEKKSTDWWQKVKEAADKGDPDAQGAIGYSYAVGEGVAKDEAQAVTWFRKAAYRGNSYAQVKLGEAYQNGLGVTKDDAEALAWYRKAAERGDAKAQTMLGTMYWLGQSVVADDAQAVKWFRKAAEDGDAIAETYLGDAYQVGRGVGKDEAQAVAWFRKAAEKDNAAAQFNLGLAYLNGGGVPKDKAKAFEWYRKSADGGNAGAQYELGRMCFLGDGMPKDAGAAAKWWQKSADQGFADSQIWLGWLYQEGNGVPKDASKAFSLYQEAAAQGLPDAQRKLAGLYYSGLGAPKDLVLSYAWANLAASRLDDEQLRKGRDLVEARLTAAQLAEAERLSSTWKPGQTLVRADVTPPVTTESQSALPAGPKPLGKVGTGTIFLVSTDGAAITNHHVVTGCTELRVQGHDGLAKVVTEDEINDLALVSLPGTHVQSAVISDRLSRLRQGDEIAVFGYPLNAVLSDGGNLTPGAISAMTGLGNNTNQIQITAPIQPGSSGSPVLNRKGEVVGVVSAKLSDMAMAKATGGIGQNVNFAVSGLTLKAFLDAHGVSYNHGESGFLSFDKSNADIAEEARRWVFVIECWK